MGMTLKELFEALGALGEDGPLQPTSLRFPKALHDALFIATELGMDASVSAATREALAQRIRGFARQEAFNAHFAAFPDDMPRLSEVAKRRYRHRPPRPRASRTSSTRSPPRSSAASPTGR